MQLSNIKQFLEVYKKSLNSEDEKRLAVRNIIKEETTIDIEEKFFVFKKGVVELKTNQIVKNEIFLHKEKIVQRFKDAHLSFQDIH